MSRSTENKPRVYKPAHAEPGEMQLDYILLPYGEFYEKTKVFLDAKKGDRIRLFNGGEYAIQSVSLVTSGKMCELLCQMRYGVPWHRAYEIWLSYARMEGHGRDILKKDNCIIVSYDRGRSHGDV